MFIFVILFIYICFHHGLLDGHLIFIILFVIFIFIIIYSRMDKSQPYRHANTLYQTTRACVCASVRARVCVFVLVRVCVCVCVCVCVLEQNIYFKIYGSFLFIFRSCPENVVYRCAKQDIRQTQKTNMYPRTDSQRTKKRIKSGFTLYHVRT